MFKDVDKLLKGFQDIVKKSKEECGDKLEEIRQLILINRDFYKSLRECFSLGKKYRMKYGSSLALMCYLELWRISGHILFFAYNGLYRNAFNDIRYALESIVQALYIDHRHPQASLDTKIEILKEVEDKREYRAIRLIGELEIDHKEKLEQEYKKLSRIIHPTHEQIIATFEDIKEDKGVPVTLDCEEISKIFDSMKIMHDTFFFLFINYFPELKEALQKNSEFVKDIKKYNLTLLSKLLKVKLGKTQ